MSLRVTACSEAKPIKGGAVAKASLNRAIQSQEIDAKRDDLPLARVKHG